MRTTKQQLGAYGETVAARHLSATGMQVLDRNWRGEGGELDLVLMHDGALVVCEVKTRSSVAFGSPLEGVTALKVRRLRRLAAQWAAAHAVHPDEIRIDLVGVLHGPSGDVVDHVAGVG